MIPEADEIDENRQKIINKGERFIFLSKNLVLNTINRVLDPLNLVLNADPQKREILLSRSIDVSPKPA